jgi:long-subunit fatty acid transport protein
VVIDGIAGGRSGARFTSNGTAKYRFDDQWSLAVNVSWNFADKNKIVAPFGVLITEPKNSNSHVFIASIEPTYRVTDTLRLGVNYSLLYRNANFYDQIQEQFSPAKEKHSVGASATYALTRMADLTLRGSHAWIRQEDSAFLPTTFVPPPPAFGFQPPVLRYESWAASVSANMRF